MKKLLLSGVAALGLGATPAMAEVVTVFGPWLGPDQQSVEAVLAAFAAKTGHDVRYVGSDSFEQQAVIDLEAGSAPNVLAFPQPGLAADMAARGFLTPLGDDVAQWLAENYAAGPSWVDLGTYLGPDGKPHFYGFPFKEDVKSLVWYVPENFADAGYEIPQSMEDLKALTEQIAADGGTPWCIGLGSGAATGWPATDWVEDFMLRMNPPEVYDQWVKNEIPFDDARVVAAIEEFGWFAKNEKFVVGGPMGVVATDFRDSPKGLFTSPPQCYMHRQASFIPAFFPEGTKVGQDVDFFYFPAYKDKDLGKPVLGAGTTWVIGKDSQGAHDLIAFLETPEAHEIWMARKGFLTPFKKANPDAFSDPTLRKMNDILLNATTFRFDASDLMPGAIGAGAFWTGMVDYVSGAKTAQQVAWDIQKAWNAIK